VRLVFAGAPGIAAEHLEALARRTRHEIAAVLTQPDAPKGRGQKLGPPPAKIKAQAMGIKEIFQPANAKDPALRQALRDLGVDLGVVVAYGKILPPELLSIPIYGFINVHFSLLPKLRGPSPVETAILEGLDATGVTTFHLNERLDAGDLVLQRGVPVSPAEAAPELKSRLSALGQDLLVETLGLIESGRAPRIPQVESEATRSRLFGKEDARLDPSRGARHLERQVRAFREWPKAWMDFEWGRIQVLQARAVQQRLNEPWRPVPGQGFLLSCSEGSLLVEKVQPASRGPMGAWDFLQGLQGAKGLS